MTTITPHLCAAELERRYKTAGEPIAKSHFHALWLLSQGYDIKETAALLCFSTRWVRSLVKRYNEGGPERLGDQRVHNGTEPSILTAAALAALKQRLGSSSTARAMSPLGKSDVFVVIPSKPLRLCARLWRSTLRSSRAARSRSTCSMHISADVSASGF